MTVNELKAILPELQFLRFDPKSSDARLFAYLRTYAAVHNLVFVNALDEEFGARTLYREKLDLLYGLFRHRYARRSSVAIRAELLLAMFSILRDVDFTVDRRKEGGCIRLADRLVSEYLADFRKMPVNSDELFGIMKLVLVCLYGMVEEAGEPVHPWLAFFRENLAEWAEELCTDGHWSGLSKYEALQRMQLLEMNSYMMLDGRYNEEIRAAYDFYCSPQVVPHDNTAILSSHEIRYYGLMYELIQIGDFPSAERQLDAIACLMESQLDHFLPESDDFQICRSIVIDRCCNINSLLLPDSN